MNNDRELLQQALDALQGNWRTDEGDKAIEAIRTRLSQCDRCGEVNPADIHTCTPQREWQGLTDEEIKSLLWETRVDNLTFARVIEKVLREKNAA